MRRRDFCGMSVMAGAASLLPVGRLAAAGAESAQAADLRAVKLSGAETTIERAAVRDLRASLTGTLLAPGEEGYEAARRGWNGMIEKSRNPIPQERYPSGEREDRRSVGDDPMRRERGSCGAIRLCAAACA